MVRRERAIVLCLAWAILCLGLGCPRKLRVTGVVYPDASGKMEITIGDDGSYPSISFEDLSKATSGFSAWSRREAFKEGDFKFAKMTGYFEDINEIELWGGKDGEVLVAEFSFTKADDGTYEITYADRAALAAAGIDKNPFEKAATEEEKQKVRERLKREQEEGFEVTYAFRLPGEIQEAEGMEFDGREVRRSLDMEKVAEILETSPEVAKAGIRGRILVGPQGDLSGEIADFREEMERAKVAWEKIEKAWADWDEARARWKKIRAEWEGKDPEETETDE